MATSLAGKQLVVAPRRLAVCSRRAASTKANLTKGDLIQEVAKEASMTPKQAQAAVNIMLQTIVNSVAKGEGLLWRFVARVASRCTDSCGCITNWALFAVPQARR